MSEEDPEHIRRGRIPPCPWGVWLVVGLLFLLKSPVLAATNGRIAFFNVSMNSSLLLRQSVIDLTQNSLQLGFSFKTCSNGQLLYQIGASSDFLSLMLVNGTLEFRWKNNGMENFIHVGNSLTGKDWFYLEIKKTLGVLTLKIKKGSAVLNNVILASASVRPSLFSLSLSGSEGIYIGRRYTGCVMQGPGVQLANNNHVQAVNILWNNTHCPLHSCNTAAENTQGCAQVACQNGGNCIQGNDGNYVCECQHLFNGTSCENDLSVYGCAVSPCLNNGSCQSESSAGRNYRCSCIAGFTGTNCEINLKECQMQASPCGPGQCIDGINSFTCNCTNTGYTGQYCGTDIQECEENLNICGNGGTCYNTVGSYTCTCLPGYDSDKNCNVQINECASRPCRNNGTCSDLLNDYSCTCPQGYTSKDCSVNIDNCVNVTCLGVNTECQDRLNGYECVCKAGYFGPSTNCQDRNECEQDPCRHGAACVNKNGTYECQCVPGYTGQNCETDINDCSSTPCENGGDCHDLVNGFNCTCVPGYTGTNCSQNIDDCAGNPCRNEAACSDLVNGYRCTCVPGWTGVNCEMDINECLPNPCKNHARCNNLLNNYTCSCVPGYTGRNCETDIDDCSPNPCQNGGSCKDQVNGYFCNCTSAWMGKNCTDEYDACASSPCLNGGACNTTKPSHDFSCACQPGYTDMNCATDINYCIGHDCQPPLVCFDLINNYTCACPTGYTGENCSTDIDECANNPCQNGGTCQEGIGNYTCHCVQSFLNLTRYGLGKKLEFLVGFNGTNCENSINECDYTPSICLNDGSCEEDFGTYECKCGSISEGYYSSGKNCELTTSYCLSSEEVQNDPPACHNGGTCYPQEKSFSCVCLPGYTGTRCKVDINECESNPCLHGGRCVDKVNGYICDCHDTGFNGTHCENNIDDCASNPCQHGSSCQDLIKDYNCSCYDGYTGKNCEEDINECLINPCSYNGTCLQRSNQTLYDPSYNLPTFTNFSYANAAGYMCKCIPGITGENCTINIDECDLYKPCKNGGVCKDKIADYDCLCPAVDEVQEYSGKNCTYRLTSCNNNQCKNGTTCIPYLIDESTANETYRCRCHKGYTGPFCTLSTTASFNGNAHLFESIVLSNDYNISFSFRTTLPNVILFNWNGHHETKMFLVIELVNGQVHINYVTGNSMSDAHYGVVNIRHTVNDARWYDMEIIKKSTLSFRLTLPSPTETCTDCYHSNLQYLSHVPDDFVWFGSAMNDFRISKTVSKKKFVGCMRDIRINEETFQPYMRPGAVNVIKNCPRTDQCPADRCSGNGQCSDLWISFLCTCDRPHLGKRCNKEYVPVTFSYENTKSWASFTVPSTVQSSFDLSLFMRTREQNGLVVYLGNTNTTFVTLEIFAGGLASRVALCNSKLLAVVNRTLYNDGNQHFVRIRYESESGNYTISVNKSEVQHVTIPSSGSCHFQAENLFFGGKVPEARLLSQNRKRRATDPIITTGNIEDLSNISAFKGTIQDAQLNNFSLQFYGPNDTSIVINPVLNVTHAVNLTKGEQTDKICANQQPCKNNATCSNVFFNDFSCQCPRGFRGKDCSELDFCDENSCPSEATCQNLNDGFECLSAATFDGSKTFVKYVTSNIKPTTTINELSLHLKTVVKNGLFLYFTNTSYFLKLEIVGGLIRATCKFGSGPAEMFEADHDVSDKEWYAVVLKETTGSIKMSVQSLKTKLEVASVTHSLKNPVINLNSLVRGSTHLVLGKDSTSGAYQFYKGCLKEVRMAGILLPFFSQSEFNNFTTAEYFELSTKDSLTIGCVAGDRCRYSRCNFDSVCVPDYYTYRCQCKSGYEGRWCQTNTDNCLADSCNSKGSCVDTVDNFFCNCQPGYTGTRCELQENYCQPDPCKNNASCSNLTSGGYDCNCSDSHTDTNCSTLKYQSCQTNNDPCLNNGTCSNVNVTDSNGVLQQSFNCSCSAGYSGDLCEVKIDYCKDYPCQNGGNCTSHLTGYTCKCADGYGGIRCETDIDQCENHQCQNGGVCVDIVTTYACNCTDGWTGVHCTEDFNECNATQPCQNHGKCSNSPGSFSCDCAGTGYKGPSCAENLNECKELTPSPCQNGANCTDTVGDYFCSCAYGYEGKNCQNANCSLVTCQNQGTCSVTPQNKWQCTCKEYYYGDLCEVVGPCVAKPCNQTNTKKCIQNNTAGTHTCDCKQGWKGDKCEVDIDECLNTPCLHNSTCINFDGGYNCSCTPGYRGDNCETDINECDSKPCHNGALCIDLINAFQCNCTPGFTNVTCMDDINECQLYSPCKNQGQCINSVGSYSCDCQNTGYMGHHCNIRDPDYQKLSQDDNLAVIIGPVVAAVLLIIVIVIIVFLMFARSKRATRGTYSPSRQEVTGSRVELGNVMKPPPEERLI